MGTPKNTSPLSKHSNIRQGYLVFTKARYDFITEDESCHLKPSSIQNGLKVMSQQSILMCMISSQVRSWNSIFDTSLLHFLIIYELIWYKCKVYFFMVIIRFKTFLKVTNLRISKIMKVTNCLIGSLVILLSFHLTESASLSKFRTPQVYEVFRP